MKPNSGLPRRGLFFLFLTALLYLSTAYVVNGTSIKSSPSSSSSSNISPNKQLKNQFNDESSKHEATRQLPAALTSALNEKPSSTTSQKQSAPESSQEVSQSSGGSGGSSVAQLQQVAEKKQGDSVGQDIFGADEYVQIKPEEITVNENGKEVVVGQVEAASSEQQASQQQQQQQQLPAGGAEHKSVDDELNAHLALDSISQQESAAYQSYSPLVQARPPAAAPRAAYQPPRAAPYKAAPHPIPQVAGPPSQEPAYRSNRSPSRLPPSYITLKGKLTGINSIISQYPHPAPGYPHQGPRHLPRGAAAGYAAFRDFVRAHASKYKNVGAQQVSPSGGYAQAPQQAEPTRYEGPKQLAGPSGGYGPAKPASAPYGANEGHSKRAQPLKTKVTVAQAYIPHLNQQAAQAQYGGSQTAQNGYTNQVLAKLYGGHAPQGIGKPEYSKDYGMVIHYPQATVYTEPMTVDQLHKLTGAGISQVLEQLQYNFAHGQRDDSNTLRGNNKHHIGHGITIHTKEYYAPGKSGHYVPTTAAVISTGPQQSYAAKPSAYEEPQAASGYEVQPPAGDYQQQQPGGSYGAAGKAELGSGYERVRQIANSGNQKYNNKRSNYTGGNEYQQPAAQAQYGGAVAPSYEQPSGSGGSRYGNGEPLSAITSFIGSELDALYKANAALTKQLEPEIYAGIQTHKSSGKAYAPLKYNEFRHRPNYQQVASYPGPSAAGPYGQQQGGQYGGGGSSSSNNNNNNNRYPGQQPPFGGYRQRQRGRGGNQRRPATGGNKYQVQPARQPAAYGRQPASQPDYAGYRPQSYQQQAAAYQAAEQSLDQQMMQLLQDFRTGDDQYNSKSQPSHSINQGYPNKIMQKYQQQQQQQHPPAAYAGNQQNQQSSAYAHHDGLEIPQGPNDQIGEIADLIEALKGSIDLSKHEQDSYTAPAKQTPKQLEDVRYLASALGQAPSYAIQVPVASGESNAAYEPAGKKEADSGYQEANSRPNNKQAASGSAYQAPEGGYGAQQQQYGTAAASGYQQPATGYQQPSASYQQAPASYQQPAASYQPPAASYQPPAASYQPPAASYQPPAASQQPPAASYQEPATSYQQPSSGYQQVQPEYQQQQQQQQAPQEYQPAASAGDYGAQQQQHQPPQAASYAQSAGQTAEQAPATGYSVNEHSQVINHLVPVATAAESSQPAQSGYSQTGGHQSQQHQVQQPAVSPIAIAAPTESQYQNAQSLSSFVDSLGSDYQELLRQPAPGLLDAHNGAPVQLAVQPASGQTESSGYTSNATAPAAYDNAASASQQVASSTSSKSAASQKTSYEQQPQVETKSQSSGASSSGQQQQQQQQYKKAAA